MLLGESRAEEWWCSYRFFAKYVLVDVVHALVARLSHGPFHLRKHRRGNEEVGA